MPGILLDLRTGDPIIGEDGDFVQVADDYAFYQLITNLLQCQVGSEIWNLYYGFDLEEAIRMNSTGSPPEVIESLLADALDPAKERLLFSIDYVKATRDGQQMRAKFSVKSRLGTIVASEITIGETLNAL